MKAAVIGLGVEGKKALESLLDHDWEVYATDSSTNIDFSDIGLPILDLNLISNDDQIGFEMDDVIIDLGYTNENVINQCDAIVLSPSMYNTPLGEKYINQGKLLCDVLTKHKDIFTIAITGTNGKTTTVTMLEEILINAGLNVLTGGNAGGGFYGYYDLILEAENGDYDVMLIEACDMTLDFVNYCFDIDIAGLTNIGNDHMNVHKTIENYKNTVANFFSNINDVFVRDVDYNNFKENISNPHIFDKYDKNLKLFGEFNKFNAGLAKSIASKLDIDEEIIDNTLTKFLPVDGRLKVIRLNECDIYIGKTDNSSAVKSLLDEKHFYAAFIGTPRSNEESRLDILDEIAASYPEVIVLFPGLENTLDQAKYRLHDINFNGRVEIAFNLDDIIGFVAEYSFEDAIFIGGNGQDKIIEIQDRLEEISKSLNEKN